MPNHLIDTLRTAPSGALFAETPDGPVTYGDLFERAARMAHALMAAGLAPGDRVAAQVQKSAPALELYLGTVMAGGAFLPLNPAYTDAEIAYFLDNAEPRILVHDPSRMDQRALSPAVPFTLGADGSGSLTEARDDATPAEPIPRGPDDLAAILYTSGTTGRSKGAMLSHRNLASNAETLAAHWRFTPEDRLIHALPIFHTHGLFVATNVTLVAGSSLIFFPSFDAEAVISAMPRATALMGVPTFYTRLLEHPGLAAAAQDMRLFVSGSAPLLEATHIAWRAATGAAILERYGMTETNMITSNPYDGERRAGTVGQPLPGVSIRITGQDSEVPGGEIGVIEVQGPNVFQGYWRMPEKTAEEFRDGWFVTGDLGRIEDGYVQIVGRSKDLIISGGFNVYPKEVEAVLDALPGVLESAVIGLPHPDFGEGVAAAIVPEPGADPDEAALLGALKDRLARFKQPKRLFVLDALPRNAMGKVQKAELRKRYAETFAPARA